MTTYDRSIFTALQTDIFSGKAIVLTGPRQVGKTTLARALINSATQADAVARFNGDYPEDRELLNTISFANLKRLVEDKRIIFIDEGQKIQRIGEIMKSLVDKYADSKQVLVTGSSSIHLLSKTQEPLTGRKRVYRLLPLSMEELIKKHGRLSVFKSLEEYMIFGLYPEVVTRDSYKKKEAVLLELATSNLYQDILEFQEVRNPAVLQKLLKALALQVGSEVSLHQLGNMLNLDLRTVERYIDLLEKSYVIFRLPPYSTNKRRELKKQNKVFFYDVGIRNAILQNFNNLDGRLDVGGLWENFVLVERMKYRLYNNITAHQYFWKTYDGGEIDLVEEKDGKLGGFEVKWQKKSVREPKSFLKYENSSFDVVNRENFLNFVAPHT